MIKKIVFAIMLLAAGQQAQAQFSFGVRGGIISATANLSEDLGTELENRLGALGGIVGEIRFNEGFAIQPELNYVQRGWQSTFLVIIPNLFATETVTKTRINYIELPILLKAGFNLGPARLDLLAGPSFSKAISGKNDVTTKTTFLAGDENVDKSSSEIEFDNDFKKNDLNAQLGLSLSFGSSNNRLFVDGRYLYGIADINDNNAIDAKITNRGFVVSAGLLHAF